MKHFWVEGLAGMPRRLQGWNSARMQTMLSIAQRLQWKLYQPYIELWAQPSPPDPHALGNDLPPIQSTPEAASCRLNKQTTTTCSLLYAGIVEKDFSVFASSILPFYSFSPSFLPSFRAQHFSFILLALLTIAQRSTFKARKMMKRAKDLGSRQTKSKVTSKKNTKQKGFWAAIPGIYHWRLADQLVEERRIKHQVLRDK